MVKDQLQKQLFTAHLENCRTKTSGDPVIVLKRALDNVKPTVEVRSRRVGGATYQVPVEVKPARALALGLRWIVDNSQRTPREVNGRAIRK